jgi:hypothetical protein
VFTPRGTGLRSPVSQRRSGWIYLGVVVFGGVFVTTTLMTGQPLWSLVPGIVLAVATIVAFIVVATGGGGTAPASDAPR